MPRERHGTRVFPERLAFDGSVVITRRELALLNGLLDRPDATASSLGDWISAAMPYLDNRSPGALVGLSLMLYTIPTPWVARAKVGSRVQVTLQPRGRDILSRIVQTRIRGHGIYRGPRSLRETPGGNRRDGGPRTGDAR